MPIPTSCSSCRSSFTAPDDSAGKRAKCPTCGGVIEIPSVAIGEEILDAEPDDAAPQAADIQPAVASQESEDADRRPCPMCGEMIRTSALKCRFCGEVFDATIINAVQARSVAPLPGESVEDAARRLLAQKHDRTTAIQLLVTSLIGCFPPILFVYGLIFLLRRPYSFPEKSLAIVGTVIHGVMTLLLIIMVVVGALAP